MKLVIKNIPLLSDVPLMSYTIFFCFHIFSDGVCWCPVQGISWGDYGDHVGYCTSSSHGYRLPHKGVASHAPLTGGSNTHQYCSYLFVSIFSSFIYITY